MLPGMSNPKPDPRVGAPTQPRAIPDFQFTIKTSDKPAVIPQVQQGSLIVNTDTKNAVWVSTQTNVAPGVGTRIGPLGSLSWTQTSQYVYAVVDTGVATPIIVHVSASVTNPDNPVDVGLSVAAQILLTGVPNVLTTTTIFGPTPIAGSGLSAAIDVSGYASVIVSTGQVAKINAQELDCIFYDAQGNQGTSYEMSAPADSLGLTLPDAVLPVRFPTLRVSNVGVDSQTVTVQGTNRASETAFSNVAVIDCKRFILNTAWVTNVPQILGYSPARGLTYLRLNISGSTLTGQLGYSHKNDDFIIADSTETHAIGIDRQVFKEIVMPQMGVVTVKFYPLVTTSAQVTVEFCEVPL